MAVAIAHIARLMELEITIYRGVRVCRHRLCNAAIAAAQLTIGIVQK